MTTPPPPSTLPELHALLDAGQAHAPEYDHGLSNHLPMLLQALHALGASPGRLEAYARRYAERLEPASPPAAALARWTDALGHRGAYPALRATFAGMIERQGARATLADALPLLMPGVAAGAFHALLRTAHAVQAGHDGELASGLAYWAAAYQTLGTSDVPASLPRSLPDWVAAVLALPPPGDPGVEVPRIVTRMVAWSHAPGFAAVAASLDAATPLDDLARFAADAYAATRNFTVLHVVTSCQAMRMMAPWQPDPEAARRHYTIAVAAGLRAARLVPAMLAATRPDLPAPLPWPKVIAAAMASDDDHLAKLVHACRALDAALGAAPGGEVFRAAASQAVRADSRATAA